MCLLGLENRGCLSPDSATPQKALTVKLPDVWSRATPVFDDENLVSYAGLVPVMALAERAGLSDLIGRRGAFTSSRLQSAGANPAGKLTSIVAGMAAGADSIDDLDAIRSGGMPRLFGGVYAAATLGQFLREFTHGHTLQLASVLRAHLVGLVQHSELLPGIGEQAYVWSAPPMIFEPASARAASARLPRGALGCALATSSSPARPASCRCVRRPDAGSTSASRSRN